MLASSLPQTAMLSYAAFSSYLDRYKRVIAKPIVGSGGKGIILISSRGNNQYLVQSGRMRRILTGKNKAYELVKKLAKRRYYLIQKRIPLATVNRRPFDVRVMVQRRKGSPWTVTGKLAKVAGAGFIITNVARSRGRVLPLRTALSRSNIRGASPDAINSSLSRIGLRAANRLQRYYPSLRMYGFDMGVDTRGKVWIIEANVTPSRALFLKLADKSMYRKIMAFSRR